MSPRAIFLDLDGTLLNDRGLVPDSAVRAVRAARARGHQVFLCTGRSLVQIWDEILDIGVDGVIAAAGGYVRVGEHVLAHQVVPVEHLRRLIDLFDAHGIPFVLESAAGLYGTRGARERLAHYITADADPALQRERQDGFGPIVAGISVDEPLVRDDVSKVLFLDSPLTLDEVRAAVSDIFDVLPSSSGVLGPRSGEVSPIGIHKALGIALLVEHLGIDLAGTVAIGDGYNDIEMLDLVGTGIAMAGAPPQLLAVADDVTAGPDADGILAAFLAHGLVGPLDLADPSAGGRPGGTAGVGTRRYGSSEAVRGRDTVRDRGR